MSDGWKRLQLADVAPKRLLEEASLAAVAPQVMVCMVCELGPFGMSDCWKRLQLVDVALQLPLEEASPAEVAPQVSDLCDLICICEVGPTWNV